MFFSYYIGVSNDDFVVFSYFIGVSNDEFVVFSYSIGVSNDEFVVFSYYSKTHIIKSSEHAYKLNSGERIYLKRISAY